jgi:predicted dehydrogenase
MENRKYKICAIGFAHTHMLHNLRSFADCADDALLVAAADTKPRIPSALDSPASRRGDLKTAGEALGMDIYDEWRTLLEKHGDMDACLVCCENADHPDVAEALLRRGIHAILEKPLAADLSGALRIARAAKAGGAKVFVNWPATWSPTIREVQRLASQGAVGRVFKLHYRNSESMGALEYGQNATDAQKGEEWWHQSRAGGGAMLDYCCYGACLSSWIMGEPRAAYGLKGNFCSQYGDAEDNAVVVARFDSGFATLEGSWSTVNPGGMPSGPIVWGSEGVMVAELDGHVCIYKTPHKSQPDEIIAPEPLPAGRATLAQEVVHCLRSGGAPHPTMALPLNIMAMSILDAGARSAASGKLELANSAAWSIG